MNRSDKFDVIIVGAGPAGLRAAKILGDAGKKVLILEKNAKIGPKVCAGGLTAKDIEHLEIPKKLLEFTFKKVFLHTKFSTVTFTSDSPFAYTINREKFGNWQLSELNKKNVIVKTNSPVMKIGHDFVELKKGEKYYFGKLIGADGSLSTVRKHLNIPIVNQAAAFHYVVPGNKYKEFEIFFDSRYFGPGYAWIFPHDGFISIGCGAKPENAKGLKERFSEWAKHKNIDLSSGKYEGFMINFDTPNKLKFDNIYLAGDAAGLASNLTGEGIYQALISGEEIAKKILNPKHNISRLSEVLKFNQSHKKAFRLLDRFGVFRQLILEIIMVFLKLSPRLRNKLLNKVI